MFEIGGHQKNHPIRISTTLIHLSMTHEAANISDSLLMVDPSDKEQRDDYRILVLLRSILIHFSPLPFYFSKIVYFDEFMEPIFNENMIHQIFLINFVERT